MAVFVDDCKTSYGRMKMCHMAADTIDELFAMVDAVGVERRHIQKAGTPKQHFDICQSKRIKAVKLGAVEVSSRQMVLMMRLWADFPEWAREGEGDAKAHD